MAFQPRTFETILTDMVKYVSSNPNIPNTAFAEGSVLRTILESAALEDDEQYSQMIKLLNSFSLLSSSGSSLNRKAAEYDVYRLDPTFATAYVYYRNEALAKASLTLDAAAGSTSATVSSFVGFPVIPFNLLVGTGLANQEVVAVSAKSLSGSNTVLTFTTALINGHAAGDYVSNEAEAAKSIASGLRIQARALNGSPAIPYITQEVGYIGQGQYESGPVLAKAEGSGTSSRVGDNKLVQFTSSPPFVGASIMNKKASSGGNNAENDEELKSRVSTKIKGLSTSTVQSIQNSIIGVTDQVTGQRVVTSGLIEDFVNNEVIVYIDDGSGFIPSVVEMAESTLTADSVIGDTKVVIANSQSFPSSGWVLISPENPTNVELIKYVSIVGNDINVDGTLTKNHTSAENIYLVDLIVNNAEEGQNYFVTTFFPIQRNSIKLWTAPTTTFTELVLDTGYKCYRGTGDCQIVGSGMTAGTTVVARYNYFTGLLATTQRVVDGDINDPVNFPGLKSAMVRVSVETPNIRQIPVTVSIVVSDVSQLDTLKMIVQSSIENYVQSLGINGNLVKNQLINIVMSINGILDVSISQPTGNVTVLENELPSAYDANGVSLVTVN